MVVPTISAVAVKSFFALRVINANDCGLSTSAYQMTCP
jgi:hypothetical protein